MVTFTFIYKAIETNIFWHGFDKLELISIRLMELHAYHIYKTTEITYHLSAITLENKINNRLIN
jgi:hypothetical protein